MTQQKWNYIIMALLLVATLVAGWFGITLPVTPEIPDPLPVDLSPLEERVDGLESAMLMMALGDGATRASSINAACYQAQGGREWVAGNGCTWTVESGATFDLQPGSTFNIAGFITSTIDALTVTGTTNIGGVLTATGGVVGNVVGNVVGDVTGALSTTAPITVSGYSFTYTAPLTITGVLTNVRLLYAPGP